MKVNFYESQREYNEKKDEFQKAIDNIITSGTFILGNEVKTFEEEVASFTGAKHAIGVASGSDALVIGADILGFKDGKEVITTPFTFLASASCIARNNGKIKFVDIEEENCGIDIEQARSAVNENTVGILPVHLFNQMCDMDKVMNLSKEYDIKVLEDAAEAFGMKWKLNSTDEFAHAGTIGHMGIYSFFPTKTLGAYGDGGMIVTDSDELAEKAKMLRVHGASKKYHYDHIGYNSRLDAIQAAILRVKLKYINDSINKRNRIAERYKEKLSTVKELKIQGIKESSQRNVYYVFNIITEDRDNLAAYLNSKGIATSVYYPKPLHLQKCFEYLQYKSGEFPVAEAMCRKILALPIYPELRNEEVDYICHCILEFFKK